MLIAIRKWCFILSCLSSFMAFGDNTTLAVWANEAIISTYTYSFDNFIARQREIAKYFTADGWTLYSNALNASKLPDTVAQNQYFVSAVATYPPEVKSVGDNQWVATMPILVIYKNPQYQQKQNLDVTINFGTAPSGQGVRGLSINSLQAKVSEAPCVCQPAKASDTQQSPNATESEKSKGQ